MKVRLQLPNLDPTGKCICICSSGKTPSIAYFAVRLLLAGSFVQSWQKTPVQSRNRVHSNGRSYTDSRISRCGVTVGPSPEMKWWIMMPYISIHLNVLNLLLDLTYLLVMNLPIPGIPCVSIFWVMEWGQFLENKRKLWIQLLHSFFGFGVWAESS